MHTTVLSRVGRVSVSPVPGRRAEACWVVGVLSVNGADRIERRVPGPFWAPIVRSTASGAVTAIPTRIADHGVPRPGLIVMTAPTRHVLDFKVAIRRR